MTITDIINNVSDNKSAYVVAIIALLSIIQISPIKINPLNVVKKFFCYLTGKEEILSELDKLNARIDSVEKDMKKTRQKELRRHILRYAKEIKDGHDKEEQEEIYRLIDEYVEITKEYGVPNSYCQKAILKIESEEMIND